MTSWPDRLPSGNQKHGALERLTAFVSRRHYRNVNDTKSGKRHEMIARVSFNTACELGFRGSNDEWERPMGAAARR
jgi:hypothetical protein